MDGTSTIDLAVGALADLLQADVVGNGACGQGPSMEGVVRVAQRVGGGWKGSSSSVRRRIRGSGAGWSRRHGFGFCFFCVGCWVADVKRHT